MEMVTKSPKILLFLTYTKNIICRLQRKINYEGKKHLDFWKLVRQKSRGLAVWHLNTMKEKTVKFVC